MLRSAGILVLGFFGLTAIAAEEHDIIISMINRNHYSVVGRNVILITQACQEYSKDEPVALMIQDLNNTYITFSSGNTCKVSDIVNPNNESF